VRPRRVKASTGDDDTVPLDRGSSERGSPDPSAANHYQPGRGPRGVARGPRRAHPKSIFDPIHGSLTLSPVALELIGDPAFQRLWGIRQTGLAHLVFPGANHTRLEHSLGVYWVAHQMARVLDLSKEAATLVEIGGLLHDLGHPPLSHTLDGPMEECLGMSHEGRSRALVEGNDRGAAGDGATPSSLPEILERHGLDPHEVADLIDPPRHGERHRSLRALLHGPIDADRIDYLQRDAHYTGVAHGAIDASRLLDTIRIRGDELVFAEKGRSAVEGFVVGRSLMYSAVYYHKTVRSAEVMAQAALERSPGYPASAGLLTGTDADLLVALEASGGMPSRLVWGLRERRLFKRVRAWRALKGPALRTARTLERSPARRRHWEDDVASELGVPEGSVLLDLSGLSESRPERSEWAALGILEDERVTHPFRTAGLWREIALRPKNQWAASVYVDPRFYGRVGRRPGPLAEFGE
jgi:uncharacterized protein